MEYRFPDRAPRKGKTFCRCDNELAATNQCRYAEITVGTAQILDINASIRRHLHGIFCSDPSHIISSTKLEATILWKDRSPKYPAEKGRERAKQGIVPCWSMTANGKFLATADYPYHCSSLKAVDQDITCYIPSTLIRYQGLLSCIQVEVDVRPRVPCTLSATLVGADNLPSLLTSALLRNSESIPSDSQACQLWKCNTVAQIHLPVAISHLRNTECS
jgi:hypothetical protein